MDKTARQHDMKITVHFALLKLIVATVLTGKLWDIHNYNKLLLKHFVV